MINIGLKYQGESHMDYEHTLKNMKDRRVK
jgi:hypothetical protein